MQFSAAKQTRSRIGNAVLERGSGLRKGLALAGILLATGFGVVALAHVLDDFGPPPAGDPSAFTGPLIGEDEAIDDLENLDPANEGAFEGGATGTDEDAGENNALPEDDLVSNNVPTDGPPSPLFGAGEFEQQMLRFEEFGNQLLDGAPELTVPFPSPATGAAPEQDPFEVAASGPSRMYSSKPAVACRASGLTQEITNTVTPWSTHHLMKDFSGVRSST